MVERGTIALSATPCLFLGASSAVLRVDNVCSALALSIVGAHVRETAEQVLPSVKRPRDRARHYPGGFPPHGDRNHLLSDVV